MHGKDKHHKILMWKQHQHSGASIRRVSAVDVIGLEQALLVNGDKGKTDTLVGS